MTKFKKLNPKQKEAIETEVKMMIAAHRDCLWSRWVSGAYTEPIDPTDVQCYVNEGYYGEAFGIVRGLVALGYGYLGSDNLSAVEENRSEIPEHNLKWYFNQIKKEYLREEGFFDKTATQAKCSQLLKHYQEAVRE